MAPAVAVKRFLNGFLPAALTVSSWSPAPGTSRRALRADSATTAPSSSMRASSTLVLTITVVAAAAATTDVDAGGFGCGGTSTQAGAAWGGGVTATLGDDD